MNVTLSDAELESLLANAEDMAPIDAITKAAEIAGIPVSEGLKKFAVLMAAWECEKCACLIEDYGATLEAAGGLRHREWFFAAEFAKQVRRRNETSEAQ